MNKIYLVLVSFLFLGNVGWAQTQPTDQTVCSGSKVLNLVPTGFRWYLQEIGGPAALSSTTLLTTRTYYASQTIGGSRSAVTVTVSPATRAGIIKADSNGYTNVSRVCVGNDITFTLTGHVGNLIQWQKRTSLNGSWEDVGTNSSTFTITNVQSAINSSIYVRTIINDTACPSTPRISQKSILVRVLPPVVPGILTGGKAICANSGGRLRYTPYATTYSIRQWVYSTGGSSYTNVVTGDNGSFFTAAPFNNYNFLNVTNVKQSVYFKMRLREYNGTCTTDSNVQAFTVTNTVAAGTISGPPDNHLCFAGKGTLTLTGAVGAIRWEFANFKPSSNGPYGAYPGVPGNNWLPVPVWDLSPFNPRNSETNDPITGQTSATLLIPGTHSRQYRAIATGCTSDITDVFTVIVDRAAWKPIRRFDKNNPNVLPSGPGRYWYDALPNTSRAVTLKIDPAYFGDPTSWVGDITWERNSSIGVGVDDPLDPSSWHTIKDSNNIPVTGDTYTIDEAEVDACQSIPILNYYRARFTLPSSPCFPPSPLPIHSYLTPYKTRFSNQIRIYYYNASPNCKFAPEATVVPNVAKSALTVLAYPNPYTENFRLSLSTSSDARIGLTVYDMIGRQIEQKEFSSREISELQLGKGWPSGIYNIIFTQEDETKTLRVIKQ